MTGDRVRCHWITGATPEERAAHPDAVALHSDPDHLGGCDSWQCVAAHAGGECGNTGPDDGFVPCDEFGNEIDPSTGTAFTFMFCGRCSALLDTDGFYTGGRRAPGATDLP